MSAHSVTSSPDDTAEKHFASEKTASVDDSSLYSAEYDSVYGGTAVKLNVPADWPELASHEPKKYYFWNISRKSDTDLDQIATQVSVFDDPEKEVQARPIETYENIHRYDPKFRWSWREERSVVRKVDWRIMVWCGIMFMALQLDRGNISQAVADNFLTDLGFTTNGEFFFCGIVTRH